MEKQLEWLINPAVKAFKSNNPQESRDAHNKIYEEPHKSNWRKQYGKYIEMALENAILGIVISLILLAISFAIKEKSSITFSISSIEISALLALAFALGYLHFQKIQEQNCLYETEKRRELWECDNYIEGEQKEMIELYTSRGLPKEHAETVIKILSSNKKFFVDLMMKEELQLIPPSSEPFYGAIATSMSVAAAGLVPFIPILSWNFLASFLMVNDANIIVGFSLSISLATLFAIGATRNLFVVSKWWKSGLQSLLFGLVSFVLTFYFATVVNKSAPFK